MLARPWMTRRGSLGPLPSALGCGRARGGCRAGAGWWRYEVGCCLLRGRRGGGGGGFGWGEKKLVFFFFFCWGVFLWGGGGRPAGGASFVPGPGPPPGGFLQTILFEWRAPAAFA